MSQLDALFKGKHLYKNYTYVGAKEAVLKFQQSIEKLRTM